jgi:pyrimidine deaminase RibD-like protein
VLLAKLDGTAKGGMVVAIARELRLPVLYLGVGEGAEDLVEFRPRDFASALFCLTERGVCATGTGGPALAAACAGAWRAAGAATVAPNPMVGAVLVRDGEVVGEGWHRRGRRPHAEVEALARPPRARPRRDALRHLEPCSHHGRTPPCARRRDRGRGRARGRLPPRPQPAVAGRGLERLRAAGIAVRSGATGRGSGGGSTCVPGGHLCGRPAVTLKWAMSLDGRIATRDRREPVDLLAGGRRWALELREEHDAVLVGSGTAGRRPAPRPPAGARGRPDPARGARPPPAGGARRAVVPGVRTGAPVH